MVLPHADLPLPTLPTSTIDTGPSATASSATASLLSTRMPDSTHDCSASGGTSSECAASGSAAPSSAFGMLAVSAAASAPASNLAACSLTSWCDEGVAGIDGAGGKGQCSDSRELLLAFDLSDKTSQSSASAPPACQRAPEFTTSAGFQQIACQTRRDYAAATERFRFIRMRTGA